MDDSSRRLQRQQLGLAVGARSRGGLMAHNRVLALFLDVILEACDGQRGMGANSALTSQRWSLRDLGKNG